MKGRFFHNTWAIFKRELAGYFGSPIAYVFIVIFLALAGSFTFLVSKFFELGQADLRPFFEWHPWIYLFLVSAVAMRLFAEERKVGTIELVLTLPVTMPQVIMGKFLAAWVFIGIALALTFPMVITVAYLGNPDLGAIAVGYVGSFLVGGAYLSVGTLTSALTKNQVIAFVVSFVVCLFLVMAGWPPVTDALVNWAPRWIVEVVSGFSVMSHYMQVERGVLALRDLVYFFSLMFFMLFATGVILQYRRAS